MSTTSLKPKIRPFRFRHSSRSLKFSTGMALETNKEKMEKIISFNLLPIKLCYSLKEVQNKEFRPYMEDYTLISQNIDNDPNKSLFCIFDGHGGSLSAEICKNNIVEVFTNNLHKNINDMEQCFIDTFNDLDELCLKSNCIEIGNTATVVYINDKKLYCGNVGDSSAVIVYNEEVMKITYNDRCDDAEEKNRILKAGGKIINKKLNDILCVTRAIGDFDLKQKGLINIPHLYRREITYSDKYVIIASDGIWDVVTNEMILNIIHSCKNCNDICGKITNIAINLGSHDNISCIVISFHEELHD